MRTTTPLSTLFSWRSDKTGRVHCSIYDVEVVRFIGGVGLEDNLAVRHNLTSLEGTDWEALMNAERLRGIVDFLLGVENKEKIQDKLDGLSAQIDGLAGSPADQNAQRNTAAALDALQTTVGTFYDALSPAQKRNIAEVRAGEFFSRAMVDEISSALAKNGITPAVVREQVRQLKERRYRYIETLRNSQTNLDQLGVREETLSAGQAEIGFSIPKALFSDALGGLQNELKVLNGIIRTFYEISNITPEPIIVRQVSTTDFLIFVEVAVPVLIALGHTVTWCIATIKGTLEIKNIASQARAANVDATLVEGLEQQIHKMIEKSVKEKTEELMTTYNADPQRASYLKQVLEKSLDQLLERVANGVTVEIRLLPPAKQDGQPDSPTAGQYDELREIANKLDFPQLPPGRPVLQITQEPPDPA
jgi:hypothetical protein